MGPESEGDSYRKKTRDQGGRGSEAALTAFFDVVSSSFVDFSSFFRGDMALIFNSKQLEELENMHDSGGFEDGNSESESNDESNTDSALAWRRSMIEEAATHVKRAHSRPVDPSMTYEVGSLLFDRDTRRFGRVRRSVPGYLYIAYLTGGDRELGNLDLDKYLKANATEKTLLELCTALGMGDEELEVNLRRLKLNPKDVDFSVRETEEAVAAEAEAQADAPPAKGQGKKKAAAKKGASAKASKKTAAKKATKKAKATGSKKTGKKGKGGSDPIEDPNAFIKENYQEMSNRELARHTGLSEHTIRRKLGEWRLRRKR
jgi:hypothetical protein